MRKIDQVQADSLDAALMAFHQNEHPLPGVLDPRVRAVLVEQLVDSVRRVRYTQLIQMRPICADRADPDTQYFDPILAAVFYHDRGDIEEALWLVFLSVHFGKHSRTGWGLTREVYRGLGGKRWSWSTVCNDLSGFQGWLSGSRQSLAQFSFGNHRKYESLGPNGTGAVVESYVAWAGTPPSQVGTYDRYIKEASGDAELAFALLYRSLSAVHRFGRLAKFDYLAMVGKLGLAPIRPDSLHLNGATGPYAGACRLLGLPVSRGSRARHDELMVKLGRHLGVGPQVMEDALCNWNKSPTTYRRFRG